MFSKIKQAGIDFAQNGFSTFARSALKPTKLDDNDKSMMAGTLAIGAGNFARTLGFFGLAVTAVAAIVNPVTLPLVVTYVAAGGISLSAAAFGAGMMAEGDRQTGLLTFSRELRKGIFQAAREEVSAFTKKHLSLGFKQAAAPATENEKAPTVAPVAPQQQPKL